MSMHILRALPFLDSSSTLDVAGEAVAVRAYQIIIHVSLFVKELSGPEIRVIPAVLDTGHSHNFSISEEHLLRWASISKQSLSKLGAILVNQQEVPLCSADVLIHRNRPSTKELLPNPFHMHLQGGISVFPKGDSNAPRLPLLGIRGIMQNGLQLVVQDMAVTLKQVKARHE